ncbi:MAG: hypothetical protein HON68_12125 [Gammaproteobacteria bacterium]|nr:hypothetical protein [Gammaproteobacteria bacterium]MBT3488401.1 hypothetical protein [Gammaproteobacteria bacterium]MBT3717647.1 hypothetical protein [Gammaproteobacteria bacterium]MBT3844325.1 hypothetical protein [Gammaproteobacteria bacterium]MBT3893787.1 hypothetical protein [Gammaproteobacteria bacterium]
MMSEKIKLKDIMLPLVVVMSLLLIFVPPMVKNPIPEDARLKLSQKYFQLFRKLNIESIETPTDSEKRFAEVTHYMINKKSMRDEEFQDRYELLISFPGCFVISRESASLEINMCDQTIWQIQYFELLDYLVRAVVEGLSTDYPKKIGELDPKEVGAYSKINLIWDK